jgi:hypothetical protein
MWTLPATGATAGEIAGFVGAHRSALLVAMVLTTAAVGLWLLFGVGVWMWLRETIGSDSVLSVCFLVGLVSFVTLLFAGFTSFFVLLYRSPEASDPRLLYDLSFGLLAISGAPTALALGSYAALVFRCGRLPAWTAWVAIVAGDPERDTHHASKAGQLDRAVRGAPGPLACCGSHAPYLRFD